MTRAIQRRDAIDPDHDGRDRMSRPSTASRTIGDLLDRVADQTPNHEALVSLPDRKRYTYHELKEAANSCARGLIACGVRPLDRVCMGAPNVAALVISQLALAKIGAVLVSLDPAWDSAQMTAVLTQSHAVLLILASSFQEKSDTVLLNEICPEARTSPRGQIRCRRLPALHTVVSLGTRRPSGAYCWGDVLALGDGVSREMLRVQQQEIGPDDPVTLLYSRDEARAPTGATGSHENLLAAATSLVQVLALTRQDRLCIAIPASQPLGLGVASLACLAVSAVMVLPPAELDPPSLLQTVQDERCTVMYGPAHHLWGPASVPGHHPV